MKEKPLLCGQTRFWLVRHAESRTNATGQLTGHMDVSLSTKGTYQAMQLRPIVTRTTFSHIACSALKRTHQTLTDAFGFDWREGHTTIVDAALNERDCGSMQGTRIDYSKKLTLDMNDGHGETYRDVGRRVYGFLNKYSHAFFSDVLICAHSGSLRMLQACLVGMDDPEVVLAQKYMNAEVRVLSTDRIYLPSWLETAQSQ